VELSLKPSDFHAKLDSFKKQLKIAAACGYQYGLTWIMPGSNMLEPEQYQKQLIERMKIFCELLGEYGLILAVEAVGVQTLRSEYLYPYSCLLGDLIGLFHETEKKNVGIVFDLFHCFCSGDTDYSVIKEKEQIITVHISDGVQGRTAKEQLDQDRRLPGETGVIPYIPFMRRLEELGYDGPIIPEPLDAFAWRQPLSARIRRASDVLDFILSGIG
jgi:sugar phosphate isomerase/epimerase